MKKIILPIIAMVVILLFSFAKRSEDYGVTKISDREYEVAENNTLPQAAKTEISYIISSAYGITLSQTSDYELDYLERVSSLVKNIKIVKVILKKYISKRNREVFHQRVAVVGYDNDGGSDDGGEEDIERLKIILNTYSRP